MEKHLEGKRTTENQQRLNPESVLMAFFQMVNAFISICSKAMKMVWCFFFVIWFVVSVSGWWQYRRFRV